MYTRQSYFRSLLYFTCVLKLNFRYVWHVVFGDLFLQLVVLIVFGAEGAFLSNYLLINVSWIFQGRGYEIIRRLLSYPSRCDHRVCKVCPNVDLLDWIFNGSRVYLGVYCRSNLSFFGLWAEFRWRFLHRCVPLLLSRVFVVYLSRDLCCGSAYREAWSCG